MRKTGVAMRARYIFSKIGGSAKEVSTLIAHLKRYDESEVAQERLRIIKFYEKNGEKITKVIQEQDKTGLFISQMLSG